MRWLLFLLLLPLAAPLAAQDWQELERQDLRLAQVAEHMLIANERLCRSTMPVTGLILHSADQYRAGAATERFRNGQLSVAAVRPQSPADMAGIRRDDAITAINGQSVTELVIQQDGHLREAAFAAIADTATDEAPQLMVNRDGQQISVEIPSPRGCRTLVEIILGGSDNARSDGKVIQLRYDFAAELRDDQLATVFAHELAHTVLEHRRRKVEAGIEVGPITGLLGENQRANRQAEIEADRLSVHLLANTGYDPGAIAAFWRTRAGRDAGGGAMPSFIYPTVEDRAELVEREIALYLPLRRGPTWPGHLLELRERGF